MNATDAPTVLWQDAIRGLDDVDPATLVAHPQNPRLHPPAQLAALRTAIAHLGYLQPVLLNDRTGHLLDGHARVQEAVASGQPSIRVLHVDVEPEREGEALLSLDPIASMAGIDLERLDALRAATQDLDPALARRLAQLAASLHAWDFDVAPEPYPERAAALVAQWQPQPGQLWQAGRHRLLCGDGTAPDVLARLLAGACADLLWTDPPWGVDYVGLRGGVAIAGDEDEAAIAALFAVLPAVLHPEAWVYCCGGYAHAPTYARLFPVLLGDMPHVIVWDKGDVLPRRLGYHAAFELIYYGFPAGSGARWYGSRSGDTARDLWSIAAPTSATRAHATEKPVDLPGRAIGNSCPPGGSVLDPFAGVGGVFMAAEQLGRVAYGCELEPAYVAVTLDRLARLGLDPRPVADSGT